MISVSEALNIIQQNHVVQPIVVKQLHDALHYTIANPIYSPIDWPTHPQAAMDGYGLMQAHWQANGHFKVQQLLAAGHGVTEVSLQQHEAVRIFTGAFVPKGVDTIIQQEHIRTENGQLLFPDSQPPLGQHIRPAASQTRIGDEVANPGDVLTPARGAFLAGLGIHEVTVFEKPRIRIICTGSELQQPGSPLNPGMIYESNSIALEMALKAAGHTVQQTKVCADDMHLIKDALYEAIQCADVVLVTGGVSVGDYDIVVPVLTALGVKTLFHKVKQKPGKPCYFGKQGNCAVFGLPGNPASVLTCFYLYTLPYLGYGELRNVPGLMQLKLPLQATYTKKAGLTHLLRANTGIHGIRILPHQESYKMDAFAEANSIVVIDESIEIHEKGMLASVYLLQCM